MHLYFNNNSNHIFYCFKKLIITDAATSFEHVPVYHAAALLLTPWSTKEMTF